MTDQIPADLAKRLHELAGKWATSASLVIENDVGSTLDQCADELRALLPAPLRPTLADMTPEERAACRWMQADVANRSVRYVIANPYDDDADTALVSADGEIGWFLPGRVTPRPDLPRMEWPDADQGGEEVTKVDYVSVAGGRTAYGPWTVARLRKKADPAPALPDGWRLADHEDHGRVIVTNTIPNRNGNVCIVLPTIEDARGYDWDACRPDELTYINTGQEVDQ